MSADGITQPGVRQLVALGLMKRIMPFGIIQIRISNEACDTLVRMNRNFAEIGLLILYMIYF
jgi:hypothetical protein